MSTSKYVSLTLLPKLSMITLDDVKPMTFNQLFSRFWKNWKEKKSKKLSVSGMKLHITTLHWNQLNFSSVQVFRIVNFNFFEATD